MIWNKKFKYPHHTALIDGKRHYGTKKSYKCYTILQATQSKKRKKLRLEKNGCSVHGPGKDIAALRGQACILFGGLYQGATP